MTKEANSNLSNQLELIKKLQQENKELRSTCKQLTEDATIRSKEMTLLYTLNSYMERWDVSIDEIFNSIVSLPESSWPFPDNSQLHIKYYTHEYYNTHKLTNLYEVYKKEITVDNNKTGHISLETQEYNRLSSEQRHTLDQIADSISKICYHRAIHKKQLNFFMNNTRSACIVEKRGNDFIITQINDSLLSKLSIENSAQIIPQPLSLFPLIPDEEAKQITAALSSSKGLKDHKVTLKDTNGNTLKLIMNALLYPASKNLHYVCVFSDNTAPVSKETMREMKLSASLINNLPTNTWVIDSYGNQVFKNATLNKLPDILCLSDTQCKRAVGKGKKSCSFCPLTIKPSKGETITKTIQAVNNETYHISMTAAEDNGRDIYILSAIDVSLYIEKVNNAEAANQIQELVLDNLNTSIINLDAHGTMCYANKTAAKTFGYDSPADLMASSHYFAQNPIELLTVHTQILQTGSISATNIDFVKKDGSSFPALIQGKRIPSKDASKYLCIIEIQDISHNQLTPQILTENNDTPKYITEVINNAKDALFSVNLNSQLLHANKRIYTLLGYSNMEEFKTKFTNNEVISFEDISNIKSLLKESGYVKNYICEATHKNSSKVFVSLSLTPSYLSSKTPHQYIGIAQNITTEQEVKLQLEQVAEKAITNEKRVSIITEQASNGIALVNGETGKLAYTNNAFRQMIQYSEDELNNIDVYDLEAAPSKYDTFFDEVNRSPNNKLSKRTRLLRKDGSILVSDIHASKTTIDNTKYLVTIHRDATPLINKEYELTRAKELAEQRERENINFLMSITHEIRTPLNGILGFIDLLRDPELTESHDEFLNTITKSGEQLLATINDLLNISKHENPKTEINTEELHVKNLIRYHYDFFKPQAIAKNIEINIKYSSDRQHDIITSNKKLLDGILTNLIKNAIKFTDEGQIDIECTLKDEQLVLYIKDTGIGIPKDTIPNIFKPYIQANNSANNEQEGTGLGLSIVRKYVKVLGGTIALESDRGKGAKFTISIPLQEEGSDSASKQLDAKKNILLIESDQVNQKYLEQVLRNYELTIASSIKEGMNLSQAATFSLIILNPSTMGENIDNELIMALKSENPDTPLLLQTTQDKDKAEKVFHNVECDKIINIPYTKQQLLKVVTQLSKNC